MNILDVLNSAFADATDGAFDYTTSAIWECNLKDSVDKPQVFWARPFISTDTWTKQGIKTTRVIANIFFLKPNKFTDNQAEHEPLISDMITAKDAWYEAFESNENVQPKINSIRTEDVYKFLDINFAGVSTVVDFEFTNNLC